MAHFYTVHVASGRENKVRDALLARAISQKAWGETILQILIPTEKTYVTKGGDRTIVDKKIYPGYLFIEATLDDETQKLVQGTDGVSSFVRSGKKPLALSESEVSNILKSMEQSDESLPKSDLENGDTIVVVSGPFESFTGTIEKINQIKNTVSVYINIFGRDTLTEFNINEVELQK